MRYVTDYNGLKLLDRLSADDDLFLAKAALELSR